MKKILCVLFAIIACFTASLGLTACDSDRVEIPVEYNEIPENTNPNLQYFGYFHSDGLNSQPDHYDLIESLGNSNVYMINSAWGLDLVLQELEKTQARGRQAWVSIHFFMQWNGLWKDGGKCMFWNGYREHFVNTALPALNEYIEDGTMMGVYFDEPQWNGVTHEDFITVTKMIREEAPTLRIMNCMTIYDLGIKTLVRESDGAVYPLISRTVNQYVTDVTYDSYLDWDENQRQDFLTRLKSVSPDDAKIWGCATGFINENAPKDKNGKFDTYEMKKAILGMYKEAIAEPRYVGILNFTMSSSDLTDPNYEGSVGTNAFIQKSSPYYDLSVKKLNINVGRKIIGLGEIDITE